MTQETQDDGPDYFWASEDDWDIPSTIWRKILSIAQDEQAGDYRHYLISYELERLWARAQQQLVDNQRSRSGLRGWVARKLEL